MYNRITTLFLVFLLIGCHEKKEVNKPNIIFILVDDLGVRQIGAYGSQFYETPSIDKLASNGMRFTNAYAAATVCSPTRASIMTGKYPARLHLTDFIPGKEYQNKMLDTPAWTKYLPQNEITIAEVLKNAGYKTGHFGKWHLNIDKKYKPGRLGDPGSQGFDEVLTTHKPGAGPESKYENDHHHVKEITESAIQFIESNKEVPFFAYISHNTIHAPEIEDSSLIQKYLNKYNSIIGGSNNPVQAAMLETLDKSVEEIMLKLKELDLEDNTIVVFFSDNGQLGEKNGFPFRGSKGDLYEGGIRMPLIIRWPVTISSGTICEEPVISNDFFSTFVEIANIKDQQFSTDGISIVPLLKNPKTKLNRKSLYWHYPHYHGNGLGPQGAIRKGKYKLIEWFEKSYLNEPGMYELYDLEDDPGERKNLADTLQLVVNELSKDLSAWRDTIKAQSMTINSK